MRWNKFASKVSECYDSKEVRELERAEIKAGMTWVRLGS